MAAKSVTAAVLVGAVVAGCSPFVSASAADGTRLVVIERDGNRIEMQMTDAEIAALVAGEQAAEAPAAEASAVEVPAAEAPATEAPAAPAVEAPAAEAETGPITRERAAEIALALVDGTVIEVDRDIERGRLVWYVAIREGNTVHEIYVDRNTGEIVRREAY